MELITSTQEIRQASIDIGVRMRHHAPAVQRVAGILEGCIWGNPSLLVSAMNRAGRYGYCFKVESPNDRRFYLTYDHDTETIYVKDKYRNPTFTHTFDNSAPAIDIITTIRNLVS